jgi:hypothetical protein
MSKSSNLDDLPFLREIPEGGRVGGASMKSIILHIYLLLAPK